MGRLNEYDDVERKVIEPTRYIVIDDPIIKMEFTLEEEDQLRSWYTDYLRLKNSHETT